MDIMELLYQSLSEKIGNDYPFETKESNMSMKKYYDKYILPKPLPEQDEEYKYFCDAIDSVRENAFRTGFYTAVSLILGNSIK